MSVEVVPAWADQLYIAIMSEGDVLRRQADATRRRAAQDWAHFYYLLVLLGSFLIGYCWVSMRQNERRS